jgi:hypothetical protein
MRGARTNEFNAELGAVSTSTERVVLVGPPVGGAVAVEVGHGLAHDATFSPTNSARHAGAASILRQAYSAEVWSAYPSSTPIWG